jgi:hypothetical protein
MSFFSKREVETLKSTFDIEDTVLVGFSMDVLLKFVLFQSIMELMLPSWHVAAQQPRNGHNVTISNTTWLKVQSMN